MSLCSIEETFIARDMCSERLLTKRLVDASVVVVLLVLLLLLLLLLLEHSPTKHSEGHPLYIYIYIYIHTQSYVDKCILTGEN